MKAKPLLLEAVKGCQAHLGYLKGSLDEDGVPCIEGLQQGTRGIPDEWKANTLLSCYGCGLRMTLVGSVVKQAGEIEKIFCAGCYKGHPSVQRFRVRSTRLLKVVAQASCLAPGVRVRYPGQQPKLYSTADAGTQVLAGVLVTQESALAALKEICASDHMVFSNGAFVPPNSLKFST